MRFILRLKHWQTFLLLMTAAVLSDFTLIGNPTVTKILSFAGGVFYFVWLLMIGHGLYQRLPRKIELNYNLFVINVFIMLVVVAVIKTLTDGVFSLKGLAALPGFYAVYALLHIMMFPVRCLRSYEKGAEADVGDCLGEFFLIVLWPIGIWFLQPRINSVLVKEENVLLNDVDKFPESAVKDINHVVEIVNINRLIGYGILLFLIGFFTGMFWIKYLQLLVPIGTLMTFTGIFFYFKEGHFATGFARGPKEDGLTYFWNTIVLKFWTFCFVIWMISANVTLIVRGIV
ncbi:hypothetical protein [Chryseolinea lacunae]|uniref:Uncharacterized protein n=1 Tax=Chryseolinea lacunae TaxID=2801331 RepID=A0ABS1L2P5_9BACT|nr:hypothetical protein [Chryseolinea lacunae]MBL0745961.1 hypothetical protein [Chryseolinea lacunae]